MIYFTLLIILVPVWLFLSIIEKIIQIYKFSKNKY